MPIGGHDANSGAAGGASAIATINTDNWGTAPAVGSAGDLWHVGNAPLTLMSNATDWTTRNPVYDPMGLHYFFLKGYLTATMTSVINGSRVIPAVDETILATGGSLAVSSDVEARSTQEATGAIQIGAWTIPSAQRVLFLATLYRSSGATPGILIQNAALSGTDMNNGYLVNLATDTVTIYRESAGFTSLVMTNQIGAAARTAMGIALFYDDGTNALDAFTRTASGNWIRAINTTDSTLTSMVRVGFRHDAAVNTIVRLERLMAFSQAA